MINGKQKVGYWLRNQINPPAGGVGGIVGRVFAVTSSNSIESGVRKKNHWSGDNDRTYSDKVYYYSDICNFSDGVPGTVNSRRK